MDDNLGARRIWSESAWKIQQRAFYQSRSAETSPFEPDMFRLISECVLFQEQG